MPRPIQWKCQGRARRPRLLPSDVMAQPVRAWLVIYTFVGIQMGWVLRPFVGAPELPTGFLRDEAWGNAYLEILGIFYKVLSE